MERKEEFLASKILVDFIRDFSLLTEQQLLSIRKMMEDTVRDVMNHVTHISNLASANKDKANEVLLKNANKSEIVAHSRIEIEKKEDVSLQPEASDEARKNAFESRLMRTGGQFAKHMEVLSKMDGDLQALVSRVVGSVSTDDVMAQRLTHVISSLHLLQAELAEVLSNYSNFSKPEAIKAFRNRVLTHVYLSYTSEDEREMFHRIFGYPKEAKKVS